MGGDAAFRKRLRSLDEFRPEDRLGHTARRRMSPTTVISVALLLAIAFAAGYLA